LHLGLVRRHMSHFSLKFFCRFSRSARSRDRMPFESTESMLSPLAPASMIWWAMLMPEAPAPMTATLTSAMSFLTILRALIRPATVTQAVPCWSSCQTGISHFDLSSSRMRKHLG